MIHHGDLFDVLPTLEAESIDACVTDPPYDLTANKAGGSGIASINLDSPYGRSRIGTGNGSGGFMGMRWDGEGVAFKVTTWQEIYRVLKPGAHLLAFGGTRTFHRMTCAIEDAGFEIRDCLSWLYGSGFPKSLNLPDGRGTALKPSWEPIVLARKPFKGGVKANVAQHGTGALNIDACRLAGGQVKWETPRGGIWQTDSLAKAKLRENELGRWPANVCLDEDAAALLDEQTGDLGLSEFGGGGPRVNTIYGKDDRPRKPAGFGDTGGASRFFYCAKPNREERDMGCYELPARSGGEATGRKDGSAGLQSPRAGAGRTGDACNIHPTVKPVDLMRWLVRLVTPPGGTVLDPFLGSGTTGMACRYEQRELVGIEREAQYVDIAKARIDACAPLFVEPVTVKPSTAPPLFDDL